MHVALPTGILADRSETAGSHVCQWQSLVVQMAKSLAQAEAKAAELQVQVTQKDQAIETLKRQFSESKSEKMPRPDKALRKRGDIAAPTPEEIRKRRADGQKWKDELPVQDVAHVLPEATALCGLCGTLPDHPMPPEISYSIELVPARVVRHRHVRQQASCECGSCVVTAPPPPRVGDKVQYGPRLAASLITAKCLDAVAIERYAKQLARMGVPVSPNTLFDLFHRAAEMLVKLYELMVDEVRQSEIVHAEEGSPRRPQGASEPCGLARVGIGSKRWTIAGRFRAHRSKLRHLRILVGPGSGCSSRGRPWCTSTALRAAARRQSKCSAAAPAPWWSTPTRATTR